MVGGRLQGQGADFHILANAPQQVFYIYMYTYMFMYIKCSVHVHVYMYIKNSINSEKMGGAFSNLHQNTPLGVYKSRGVC